MSCELYNSLHICRFSEIFVVALMQLSEVFVVYVMEKCGFLLSSLFVVCFCSTLDILL